jgi:hypothetical protein
MLAISRFTVATSSVQLALKFWTHGAGRAFHGKRIIGGRGGPCVDRRGLLVNFQFRE